MSDGIHEVVRTFIVERFLFGQGGEKLAGEDSFLEKGLIDSTGILEVVLFVEERFDVAFDDEDLVPANLDSIGRIARFVERKRAAAAAA